MFGKIKSFLFVGLFIGAIGGLATLTDAAVVTDTETDEIVGSVIEIQGSAIAIQNAAPRILRIQSKIFMGDVISTGKESRLAMRMIDGAEFSLGERTNFVVEEYFLKESEGNAAVRLLSGAVAIVTGKIASLNTSSFELRTAVATIGVRGTTFWGGQIDGTYQFALLKGKSITISNKAGSVEIKQIGQGTSVQDDNTVPSTPVKWGQGKLERAMSMTNSK